MIWARRILLILLLLYALVVVAAFFGQRKLLYFPPQIYHVPPDSFEEIRTTTGDMGWYSPAIEDRPTLMVFHGNGSSIDSNMHIFRDLQAAGYGVWSVGYPGYPGNEGKPTQVNLVNAAIAQYETLRDMGVAKIVYYGTSLGSGVAAQLSAKYEPDLLIMDAPFNSVTEMARQQMPFIPTRLLLKDKWESGGALEDLTVPLIWIHGTADVVIPIVEGQKLYDGYSGVKSSHKIPNAHHTNTWLSGGREIVLIALMDL